MEKRRFSSTHEPQPRLNVSLFIFTPDWHERSYHIISYHIIQREDETYRSNVQVIVQTPQVKRLRRREEKRRKENEKFHILGLMASEMIEFQSIYIYFFFFSLRLVFPGADWWNVTSSHPSYLQTKILPKLLILHGYTELCMIMYDRARGRHSLYTPFSRKPSRPGFVRSVLLKTIVPQTRREVSTPPCYFSPFIHKNIATHNLARCQFAKSYKYTGK